MRGAIRKVWCDDGLEARIPEHHVMIVEQHTRRTIRELADRKRVLGQITPEQERFVNDLLDEALP